MGDSAARLEVEGTTNGTAFHYGVVSLGKSRYRLMDLNADPARQNLYVFLNKRISTESFVEHMREGARNGYFGDRISFMRVVADGTEWRFSSTTKRLTRRVSGEAWQAVSLEGDPIPLLSIASGQPEDRIREALECCR